MLELLAFALAGIGLGLITGLIPGLHVNNLTPLLVMMAAGSGSMEVAVAIVTMSITNVFISYIPSTFLGVPDEGTALSVLPAHRLLLEGRGHLLLFPFLLVVGPAYELLQPNMHWLLIGVIGVMLALEKSKNKIAWGLAIFFLSGLLGLLTLDGNLLSGDAALMPLLSGLFGASVLLPSILEKTSLPEQYFEEEKTPIKSMMTPLCAGTAAGAITGIIPGIGPSQGTVLAQTATGGGGAEEFLTAVSSVNTSKALFSFVALYAIGKARSGAAVAVGQLVEVGMTELLVLVGIALLAGGIAAILGLKISRWVAGHMDGIPYRKL
ncbi:MAG: tripartite tricarboxylate transporter permease, partial [Candidatus Hadarchaeales archaeon]